MARARSDKFTETRLAILQAIVSDPSLRDYAVRVATLLLLKYANRERFEGAGRLEAWPAQTTIAAETGSTVNSVRRAGHELAAYLVVKAGRGRHQSSVYSFLAASVKPAASEGVSTVKPHHKQPVSGLRNPITEQRETPSQPWPKPPQEQPTNPLIEPIEEPFEGKPAPDRRKKPSRSLPEICPSAQDLDWARTRLQGAGLTIDPQTEAERFRDHHMSKGSTFADWSAAWRTWIGNAVRWARERGPGLQPRARQQSELEHALETLRDH